MHEMLCALSDMRVEQIARDIAQLGAGNISADYALSSALRVVGDQDTHAQHDFDVHTHHILSEMGLMLHDLSCVVRYLDLRQACHRAMFVANAYHCASTQMVGSFCYNRPPQALRDADGVPYCSFQCDGTTSCTRDVSTRVQHGEYDNCPAIHAAEQVMEGAANIERSGLIWVEAGVIRDGDTGYKWWQLDPNTPIYPCLQCLRYMLYHKVRWLCVVTEEGREGGYSVSYHDVALHAMTLLLMKTTSRAKEATTGDQEADRRA